jgi:hypothetical protein
MRLTNLPSGLQIASTRPSSSGVKSGPALTRLPPLRLICMTPTTFSSNEIGALMIFWIDSPVAVAVFTPSNTAACRTAEKLLLISGRLSRAVRAASAELLVSGMNPHFSVRAAPENVGVVVDAKPPESRLRRLSRAAPLRSFPRRPAETLRPPQLRRTPERRRAVPALTPGLCSCVLCYLLSSQRESWGQLSTYVCGSSLPRQEFF